MKTRLLLFSAAFLFVCIVCNAQESDSVKIAAKQKKVTDLTQSLQQQKQQLTDMESKLEILKQTADKKTTDAQQSADANKVAATNLTTDPNDRKKAKRVKRAAHQASADAKDSRRATAAVKKTEKNITSLKSKIASNEKKLAKLQPVTVSSETATP